MAKSQNHGELRADARVRRARDYEASGRLADAADEYNAYAEECAARADYAEGIKALLRVEKTGYLDIGGRLRLAGLYRLSGNSVEAVNAYKTVADELVVQGRSEDAVNVLRDAISGLPERPELAYHLADFYVQMGSSSKAVSLLMDLLNESPEDAEAWVKLAEIYRARNSISEAVDALIRAAEIYEARSDAVAASGIYETIFQIVPDNLAALKKLVDTFNQLGDTEKVIGYLHRIARLFIEKGYKERALNIFAAVLRLNPGDALAQEYVGKSIRFVSVVPDDSELSLIGEKPRGPETAEPAAEKEITIGPVKIKTDFPPEKPVRTAYDLLGLEAEDVSQPEEEDTQLKYDLGVAYLEMGLRETGINYLQVASRDPELRVRACNLLGLTFLDMGMPEIAIKEFERALGAANITEDEAISLYYNLGLAYEAAGNIDTALDEISRVYSLNINYLDVKKKLRELLKKRSEASGKPPA